MITVTRSFQFDAAHRVLGHSGKCKSLHGHRYIAEVTVSSPELDELGMVVDFSVIKDKIGKWIDDNWDHNTLLNSDDPLFKILEEEVIITPGLKTPYYFDGINPTAENIAEYLYEVSQELIPNFKTVRIRVYETPNCFAEYSPPGN